jgi:tRNA modification GTPase
MSTIFALSTAKGRAGVAIIRISGARARDALLHFGMSALPAARVATRAKLQTKKHGIIDDGLALWFPAPHSFTGEDVLELQMHGSNAVLDTVISELAMLPDFQIALPGEFTRRALMNGKMDLAQVEGLADLIDAETEQQRRQAMHFMEGKTSAFYEDLRARIIRNLAHLEAYIDFPEEDIPEEIYQSLQNDIYDLRLKIESRLASDTHGERIRDGFFIAIIGAPNVGKSSLLNTLTQRDIAIVSHHAGTTRDVLEAQLNIGGYAVTLADTAGIREQAGEVEAEGIRRSFERMKSADLTLVMVDKDNANLPQTLAKQDIVNAIFIANKCDDGLLPESLDNGHFLAISVMQNLGISELISIMSNKLNQLIPVHEPSVITRARHKKALADAVNHLVRFDKQDLLELRCEELRLAANAIGSVTGIIDIERVLDEIFRSFCIGK